jgi:hypothetical protein
VIGNITRLLIVSIVPATVSTASQVAIPTAKVTRRGVILVVLNTIYDRSSVIGGNTTILFALITVAFKPHPEPIT